MRGAVIGGLVGGASAGLFYGAGELAAFAGNNVGAKALAHGVAGGLRNVAMGRNFGQGFMAAAVTGGTAGVVDANISSSIGRVAMSAAIGGTAAQLGGGKFANGAVTGAYSRMFNDGYNHSGSFFRRVLRKITAWHFEDRHAKNVNLPLTLDAAEKAGWKELDPSQNVYHDNSDKYPEVKFIHKDGREAVYYGHNGKLVSDPKYMGTYNYVNPAEEPTDWTSPSQVGSYILRGAAHGALDVAPYWIGGNVRGAN